MVDKVLRTRLRGPSFGCVYRLATRRIMLPAVFPVLDVGGVLQTNLYWGAPGGAGMPNPAFPALRRRREPQEPSAENLPIADRGRTRRQTFATSVKARELGLIEDVAPKYRRKRGGFRTGRLDWPEWSSRRRFAHCRHFPIIFRRAAGAFPGILNLPECGTTEVARRVRRPACAEGWSRWRRRESPATTNGFSRKPWQPR